MNNTENIYNEAFSDEINKIAKDHPKTYAGTGAKIGLGYGGLSAALQASLLKYTPRHMKGAIVASMAAGIVGPTAAGAGIGYLFKRKSK